jgi:glycosyltransferase involved in cell wall biosynthesis
MEIIKILHINGGSMDNGGISKFLMSYFNFIDLKHYQFDFLVHYKYTSSINEDLIQAKGCNLYVLPSKKTNFITYIKTILRILPQYDIIHCHTDSMNWFYLFLAIISRVKIRISHSHNTGHLSKSFIKKLLLNLLKPLNYLFATHKAACSNAAAKWLFGKKHAKRTMIIYNAIQYEKYLFNFNTRIQLRERLQITNQTVIGHVGKFDFQKNHIFMINLLNILIKENSHYRLVLIGDGPNRSHISRLVEKLKLSQYVIFLGVIENVNDYLNIFDIFIFPSLFEGLGISLVEAQVNNLPIMASTNVPIEVKIKDNLYFLKLNRIHDWVNRILEINNDNINSIKENRMNYEIEVNKFSNYNILTQVKNLQNFYNEIVKSKIKI